MTHISIGYSFHKPTYRFILFCISGFLIGSILSSCTSVFSLPLMRSTLFGKMSIVSFIFLVLIPLLITAFAVLFCKPIGVYIICFAKMFIYGFAGQAISNTFHSGSWLARYFLLFTDSVVLFAMLLLCLFRIRKRTVSYKGCLIAAFGLCTTVWLFDYLIISPHFAY